MTDDPTRYRTGVLWGVLGVLLVFGSAAAAFVVYGVSGLAMQGPLLVDVPAIVGGGFVMLVAFLLMAGVLYRVDRLRGVPHRRVELFE